MQTEVVLTGSALRLHLLELLVANYDAMDGSDVVATAREAYAFVVGEEQPATASLSVKIPELSIEALAEQMRRQPMPIVLDDEAEIQAAPVAPEIEKPELEAPPEPLEPAAATDPKKFWSPERLIELERHVAAGLAYAQIAKALGSTAGAIGFQVQHRGLCGRYPRKRGGQLLFEPYPLDRPWPPSSEPLTNQGGTAEFNARQRALESKSDPDWHSKVDRARLKELIDAGETFVDIAEKLGAPKWKDIRDLAITHRLLSKTASGTWVRPSNKAALNGPTGQEKMRKCLRCGRQFLSEGPGNRMCDTCRAATVNTYDPTADVA